MLLKNKNKFKTFWTPILSRYDILLHDLTNRTNVIYFFSDEERWGYENIWFSHRTRLVDD